MTNLGTDETYIRLRAALAQAIREQEAAEAASDPEKNRIMGIESDPRYSSAVSDQSSIRHTTYLLFKDDDPKAVVAQLEREAQEQVEETWEPTDEMMPYFNGLVEAHKKQQQLLSALNQGEIPAAEESRFSASLIAAFDRFGQRDGTRLVKMAKQRARHDLASSSQ